MTRQEITSAVFNAISSTLETVAFEEPIVLNDSVRDLPSGYWAEISSNQPLQLKILIWTTVTATREIVESVTGGMTDEVGNSNPELDTIAELANILAGCFLKQVTDPQAVVKIGIPIAHQGKLSLPAEGMSFIYGLGEEKFVVHISGV